MLLQKLINNKMKDLHSVEELIEYLESMNYSCLGVYKQDCFGNLNVIDEEESDGIEYDIEYEIVNHKFTSIKVIY